MSKVEFAPGFEAELLYDSSLFNKPIEEIVDELYINFKLPDYSSGGYHATRKRDTHLTKPTSYPSYCRPFIYFQTNNDILTLLRIRDGVGVSTISGKSGDVLYRFLWYQQREDETIEYGTYGLNNDFQITDANYRLFDWNNATWGYPFYVNTNIPIFHVSEDVDIYDTHIDSFMSGNISAEELVRTYSEVLEIVNTKEDDVEPDGEDFVINNVGIEGKWTKYGVANTPPYLYRSVRGKIVNGRIATYTISGVDNGVLKIGVKMLGELYSCEYSNDNGTTWHDTDTFPYTYFYRPRKDELGTFKYGLSYYENIPHFKNEEDADDYTKGRKDVTEAENWDDIWRKYPDTWKPTGESEDVTIFSDVYTRALFSQQYICPISTIQDICNGLYDVSSGGIFEKIKKGVEMYGANPIECVQSLVYYPMDLNEVFVNTISQNYIYFGGYKYDLTNGTANKIVYPNGYKEFGPFKIELPYGDTYRSYEPYAKLRVYLAYIGWRELDIKRYAGKSVKVRYYIDTRANGLCVACLIADGFMMDYFNGQMGVSFPITLTDFSSFANNQINTILSSGGDLVNNGGELISGFMGQSPAGVGIASTKALGNVAKMEYGLNTNNITNYNATRGTNSSMINQYLPQEILFEFELQREDITHNAEKLRGYPSNASGILSEFKGYFEAQEVDLICPRATDSEKSEIESLLRSGVRL